MAALGGIEKTVDRAENKGDAVAQLGKNPYRHNGDDRQDKRIFNESLAFSRSRTSPAKQGA